MLNILWIGIGFSTVMSVLIIASMRYNARLWLNDYTRNIQDKVPPLTLREKRDRGMVSVLFLGLMIAAIIYTARYAQTTLSDDFGTVFVGIWILTMTFNLFDAVIVDYLILTLLRPRFMFLPGTVPADYDELFSARLQVVNFFKGCVIVSIISGIAAGIAVVM